MIVICGFTDGLPEFGEMIRICVVQGTMNFIVSKFSSWFREQPLNCNHVQNVPDNICDI